MSTTADEERLFHSNADATLGAIETSCAVLEDIIDGLDISSSMGVLTVKLGEKGTYVLNKQTPNRQIWWSSPVSGPRRYEWDASRGAWVNTRDRHLMLESLASEMKALTGQELHFS